MSAAATLRSFTATQLGFIFALFALVLGALVGLTVTGHDSAGLTGQIVTLAGLVGLGAHQRATSQVVAKIDRQTNGVLTARIREAVQEALAADRHAQLDPFDDDDDHDTLPDPWAEVRA